MENAGITGAQLAQLLMSCGKNGLLGNLNQRQNGGRARMTAPTGNTLTEPKRTTVLQIEASSGSPDPNATIVTLGRTSLDERLASAWWGIRASITWGTGKVSNSIVCDYHHGTRLTLDASSLRVDALYLSAATGAGTRGREVELTASAVYGQVGNRNLTLTDPPLEIANATRSDYIQVPQYARNVTIYTELGASTFDVFLSNSKAADVVSLGNQNTGVVVPIPNGIEYLSITNDGALQDFTLIWGLEL